jgi:hypothetical protein
VEKGRQYGKKGPAQMGTHYINLRHKNRQKKDWVTEGLMGWHCQESSRGTVIENSLKTEQMEQVHPACIKSMSEAAHYKWLH